MTDTIRYPFLTVDHTSGEAGLQPLLPMTLAYGDTTVSCRGLLDTGAMVNVMPYTIGEQLGADFDQQAIALTLTGNLARYEARALVVSAVIGSFEPVRLVFAWTKATDVPLLLGQVNFFMAFDVCLYRSRLAFEIGPSAGGSAS